MPGDIYKNKTRIRVNGLLIEDKSILLAQIQSPVSDELVWMPPGGGLEFGESMKAGLRREFLEETSLEISVDALIAVHELLKSPFHAIELYFKVHKKGGNLNLGNDPEHPKDNQVLKDVKWIDFDKLAGMNLAPPPLKEWITSERFQPESSQLYFQTM